MRNLLNSNREFQLDKDENNFKMTRYAVSGFLCGSSLLIVFSLLQKIIVGFNPFVLKGYIAPFVFGGVMGAILAMYYRKVENFKRNVTTCVNDLNSFFELSLEGDEVSIQKWAEEFSGKVESFCHKITNCNNTECLAYKSDCGRCWLQVGTLCGGKVQSDFSEKRKSCNECEVYREYVGKDIVRNLRELTFTLIENLLFKKQELKESIKEIKTLQGIIPICSSCKKIRDDKGAWSRLESYISEHSEAQFSHSYCNDCIRELYPDVAEEVIAEIESKTD